MIWLQFGTGAVHKSLLSDNEFLENELVKGIHCGVNEFLSLPATFII
jgi:hypothetical protein